MAPAVFRGPSTKGWRVRMRSKGQQHLLGAGAGGPGGGRVGEEGEGRWKAAVRPGPHRPVRQRARGGPMDPGWWLDTESKSTLVAFDSI